MLSDGIYGGTKGSKMLMYLLTSELNILQDYMCNPQK